MKVLRSVPPILVSVLATATTIAGPPPATADTPTVRYAGPAGAGTACSQSSPCDLVTAVNTAPPDSIVIVEPGNYGTAAHPLTTTLVAGSGPLTLEGAPGKAAPVLHSDASGSAINLENADEFVRGLTVIYGDPGTTTSGVAVQVDVADHLQVLAQNAYSTCYVVTSLSNSSCLATGSTEWAFGTGIGSAPSPTTRSTTVANVTAVATASNSLGIYVDGGTDCTCSTTVTDSILQGGAHDIAMNTSGSGTAALNVSSSSYITRSVLGSSSLNTSSDNLLQHARFRDVAAANLQEQASSPTVDAGAGNGNSPADAAGAPRVAGRRIDMGAFEYLPPPAAPPSRPAGTRSACASGSIPNGSPPASGCSYGWVGTPLRHPVARWARPTATARCGSQRWACAPARATS